MSIGVGHSHNLDLALLWLMCRLAALALIGPLAWEPYASGAALKRKRKKKKRKLRTNNIVLQIIFSKVGLK